MKRMKGDSLLEMLMCLDIYIHFITHGLLLFFVIAFSLILKPS